MGPLEQIIHTFNFMAPAWGVALFGVWVTRVMARAGWPQAPWGWLTQTVVSAVLGTAVLVGGLVLWGVDGKMTTYSALVLTCGTTQWLMCKGWRR
jgi:hypothetical protein